MPKNADFQTQLSESDNPHQFEMYICWSVMCRLSRMVQDSYCSVQDVQGKRALYKGALNRVLGKPQASLLQN